VICVTRASIKDVASEAASIVALELAVIIVSGILFAASGGVGYLTGTSASSSLLGLFIGLPLTILVFSIGQLGVFYKIIADAVDLGTN